MLNELPKVTGKVGKSGFNSRTHDSNHSAKVPVETMRTAQLICNGSSDKRAVSSPCLLSGGLLGNRFRFSL